MEATRKLAPHLNVGNGTVKSYIKKYISVHRTDATLLATNVDWKTCRVDSVNRKKGG